MSVKSVKNYPLDFSEFGLGKQKRPRLMIRANLASCSCLWFWWNSQYPKKKVPLDLLVFDLFKCLFSTVNLTFLTLATSPLPKQSCKHHESDLTTNPQDQVSSSPFVLPLRATFLYKTSIIEQQTFKYWLSLGRNNSSLYRKLSVTCLASFSSWLLTICSFPTPIAASG